MRTGEIRHAERARWGKPLAGVRVLAVEQMQALPYGTQLLAHLGADVVKVEPPERGESGRQARPAIRDDDGREVGATYLRNNLSKRSLSLDLKQTPGRDLFRRLVPHFDVVAENLASGTAARLGIDYESLAEIAPRLVYVSISGFGRQGDSPYGSWPAYAPIAEAMGGLYEPNRREGGRPPVVVAGALGDIGTALFAVIGLLAALRQRDATGLGQQVDVAMFDSMIAMTDMVPFMWSMGMPASWAGAGTTAICSSFRAKDGYFVVAVFREHHFERLATAVGHKEWPSDPRFSSREGWAEHLEGVVRPALEAWAADKTKLEAARALCELGIAAGPSNTAEDLYGDPHVAARDMLIEVPRPDAERPLLVVGNPVKLSRVAEGPVERFPRLGEHSFEVLREVLALEDAELERLRGAGII
ncbi:MAG: CoA transferase [Myxococcota bacterium]